MGTITTALHATGRIVRVTCAFTIASQTADVRVRVWRRTPDGALTRLRLSRGSFRGFDPYPTMRDFPLYNVNAVGGSPIAQPTGGSWSIGFLDLEPPQNTALTYGFEVMNWVPSTPAVLESGADNVALSGQVNLGGDFLYDLAAPGRGSTVNVVEWRSLEVAARSSVRTAAFGSAAVVTGNVTQQPSSQLTLAALTADDARRIRGMLRKGGPVYALSPQYPTTYGYSGPVYFSVTGWEEQRAVNLARESARLFRLDCQHVTPPAASYDVGAQAAVTAWGSLWSSFAVESWTVVDGVGGVPHSYPAGSAK